MSPLTSRAASQNSCWKTLSCANNSSPYNAKHPPPTPRDRVLLVLLARKLSSWKQALMIVQPDTLLRWHRDLFRWFWKPKSRTRRSGGRPPLTQETIALIKHMAQENHSWGQNVFAESY
jgi:hypothetical protein